MGGSSGTGGTFETLSPEALQAKVRETELALQEEAFGPTLDRFCGELLAEYNRRDADATAAKLDALEEAAREVVEERIDLRFGGSVAKHTYVDGLSDVNTLMIMRRAGENETPSDVLHRLAKEIADQAADVRSIEIGHLAVTINYSDGMTIQMIPAQAIGEKLNIPSATHDSWSKINPRNFSDSLTRHNRECGGKLVPVIKLTKAVNATLPESARLTGYHIEALAIKCFRLYEGPQTPSKMLLWFFGAIPSLLKSPIKDSTGQSVHVDQYLGRSNSKDRQTAAHIYERLAKRMQNAITAGSTAQWSAIFGDL